MTKTRVIFVIKSLQVEGGGAERIFVELCNSLYRHEKFDLEIITFDFVNASSFYPLSSSINWHKLGTNAEVKMSCWTFLKNIFNLRKVILDKNPDICVGFMHSAFIPLSLALIFTKIRIIASEHEVVEFYKDRPLEFFLFKIISSLFGKITFVSDKIADMYKFIPLQKKIVIPNPVFNVNTNHSLVKSNKILNIGHFVKKKDQETLIKAFAKIKENLPNWKLKIVGRGPLKERLVRLVKSERISNQVEIASPKKNISSEYLTSKIYVCSSKIESFGLATAEALAHGIPAIGFSDCLGTSDLIVNGYNGLLVKSDARTYHLAQGILLLAQNQELRQRFSSNASKSIEKYTWKNTLDLWIQSLLSVRSEA